LTLLTRFNQQDQITFRLRGMELRKARLVEQELALKKQIRTLEYGVFRWKHDDVMYGVEERITNLKQRQSQLSEEIKMIQNKIEHISG